MIRPATSQDAPAIRALWNLSIRETLIPFYSVEKTLEEVQEAVAQADGFWVAQEAETLLGFARYGPFRSGLVTP